MMPAGSIRERICQEPDDEQRDIKKCISDDANDPDPGPGLETANPEKESDDANDKENDAESGGKVAQPCKVQKCPSEERGGYP